MLNGGTKVSVRVGAEDKTSNPASELHTYHFIRLSSIDTQDDIHEVNLYILVRFLDTILPFLPTISDKKI